MGAWGRDQKTAGKVRMMADGSAEFTRADRPDADLNARGMGVRSQRYSMLVEDGVVKALNVEAPGKFEVSDAATLLEQAGASAESVTRRCRVGPAGSDNCRLRQEVLRGSGQLPGLSTTQRTAGPRLTSLFAE